MQEEVDALAAGLLACNSRECACPLAYLLSAARDFERKRIVSRMRALALVDDDGELGYVSLARAASIIEEENA